MVELGSLVPGKAHFPLLVGRDYSEKGLGIAKTKPPLAVFWLLPPFIEFF